jgi:hypothetical protein
MVVKYKFTNIVYRGELFSCSLESPTHKHMTPPSTPNLKWPTFTYTTKETTYITNLFRHTSIKIAFRTRNSILSHLTNHTHTHGNQYSSSGVYKLTCPDCNKVYIGQTDRSFSIRFNEHKQAFGTIDTTMQILQHQNMGPHLNTLERFYIHKETAFNNHLDNDHTILPNKVFSTLC